MKLNWKKIWKELDKWYENDSSFWGLQKRAIKRIIQKEFDDLE